VTSKSTGVIRDIFANVKSLSAAVQSKISAIIATTVEFVVAKYNALIKLLGAKL
jgi:hypothetical protein